MLVPDALSRLFPANAPAGESEPHIELEIDIATVDFAMHMSTRRLNQFRDETMRDPILKQIGTFIREGWPEQREMPREVLPYYPFKDELVELDTLSFKILIKLLANIIVPVLFK